MCCLLLIVFYASFPYESTGFRDLVADVDSHGAGLFLFLFGLFYFWLGCVLCDMFGLFQCQVDCGGSYG